MSAALVAGPNRFVSFPIEPGPVFVTMNPLLLSSSCNAFTSGPTEPRNKSRVNIFDVDVAVEVALIVEVAVVVALGATLIPSPKVKFDLIPLVKLGIHS
jgi:hypothetical protein